MSTCRHCGEAIDDAVLCPQCGHRARPLGPLARALSPLVAAVGGLMALYLILIGAVASCAWLDSAQPILLLLPSLGAAFVAFALGSLLIRAARVLLGATLRPTWEELYIWPLGLLGGCLIITSVAVGWIAFAEAPTGGSLSDGLAVLALLIFGAAMVGSAVLLHRRAVQVCGQRRVPFGANQESQ